MKWFSNRKMATKLFLGFAAVLAMNAAIGVFCLHRLSVVHDFDHDLALRQIPSLGALTDLGVAVNAHRRAQFEYLVARTDAEKEQSEKHLEEAAASADASEVRYGSLITNPEEQRMFEEIKESLVQYLEVSERAMKQARAPRRMAIAKGKQKRKQKEREKRPQHEPEPADLLFGEEKILLNRTTVDLQAAVDLNLRLADEASRDSATLYAATRQSIIAGMILTSVLGLALALVMGRIVVRPLHQVMAVVRKIAGGNLSSDDVAVSVLRRDEIGELAELVSAMRKRLRQVIQGVSACANRIVSASEAISCASQQQLNGAGAQHEQAGQVAAAMDQMSTTAKEISDQSSRAALAASQAAEMATKGGATIEALLTGIRNIAKAVAATADQIQLLENYGEEMGKVVDVMDDVAAQTNLLALNAAIEAARAGSQGRGFAVVANEVAKLAGRTTKAAKEIEVMIARIRDETKNVVVSITHGTSQADQGAQETRQAGELLRNIIAASQQLGEMAGLVATEAAHRDGANDHVALSLERISNVARESAAGAQRSACAVADLSALATELRSLVDSSQNVGSAEVALSKQPARSTEWGQIDFAAERERVKGHAARGLVLAAPPAPRLQRARIHARLLESGTKPEFQPPVPSSASAGKPA